MEAFRELFGAIALHALMAMLALCVAFAAARFLWRRACALAWIRRTGGCVMALALGLVTSVCVVKGSAKPLRRTGDGPPCQITAEDISNGWRVAETREGRALSRPFDGVATNISWMLRGTYSDVVRIEPPLWSFPWRDGVLGGVTVLSWGEVRPAIASSYFPETFPCRVSLTPKRNWHLIPQNAVPYGGDAALTTGESIFWHGVTPSNSLVVTWQNALYGRQASCPTNFQAEFFADGCFDYRYQDRTVEYVPVFPFDWDGDGLENSVDPDPLAAGPDAHGTNAEWYNVVCSNVFVAVEGDAPASGDMRPPGLILSPRTADVNADAYYFVEVVAERGPAPIYFVADGASRLGDPIVVARAGETNHVPLLIGATYTITSSVPFSVEAPGGASVTQTRSGGMFTVAWPAGLVCSSAEGLFTPSVLEHFRLGGVFSWSVGCCLRISGDTMRYACSGCDCGVCSAVVTYAYELYSLSVAAAPCGCTGGGNTNADSQPRVELDSGACVTAGFDRRAVLFEDAYDDTSTNHVPRHSTNTVLTLMADGGDNGGVLTIRAGGTHRLVSTGGGACPANWTTVTLAPHATHEIVSTNEAILASASLDDVWVSASIMDLATLETAQVRTSATAVKLALRPRDLPPENPCPNRHLLGVGERVDCEATPQAASVVWYDPTRQDSEGYDNDDIRMLIGLDERHFYCPWTGGVFTISAKWRDIVLDVPFKVVEPSIECREAVLNSQLTATAGEAGMVGMNLSLYVLPRTVSFDGIYFREQPVPPTNAIPQTGYFALNPGLVPPTHTSEEGAGIWSPARLPDYSWTHDRAQLPRVCPPLSVVGGIPFWSAGNVHWRIPVEWGDGTEHKGNIKPDPTDQIYEIDAAGKVSVRKYGHRVERAVNGDVWLE